MKEKIAGKKKKKGLFSGLLEKLDKKMEERARKIECCSGSDKGKSCCN